MDAPPWGYCIQIRVPEGTPLRTAYTACHGVTLRSVWSAPPLPARASLPREGWSPCAHRGHRVHGIPYEERAHTHSPSQLSQLPHSLLQEYVMTKQNPLHSPVSSPRAQRRPSHRPSTSALSLRGTSSISQPSGDVWPALPYVWHA